MPAVTKGSIEEKAARTMAHGLLFVGALSASACMIDMHDSGPEQVDPAAFSWNAPVNAGTTVFVRNTNGSVKVMPATDGNVKVTAEARWHRGDPKQDVKFVADHNQNSGNTTICAVWGAGSCTEGNYTIKNSKLSDKILGHSTDAKINFTIYVPTGVKIDVLTVSGSIGAATTAPVKARTANGSIKVATSVGPVDAETVNGDVDVRMTTLGADGPVRAHSINGSVAAYLPEKFDGNVDISSVLGALSSDYPGLVKKGESKDLTGTIGAGGRKIEIGTVTGEAALHQLKADGTVAAAKP
jgi:putative adhesin